MPQQEYLLFNDSPIPGFGMDCQANASAVSKSHGRTPKNGCVRGMEYDEKFAVFFYSHS